MIVGFSAMTANEDKERGLLQGMNTFSKKQLDILMLIVTKPPKKGQLEELVRMCFGN